MTIATKPRLQWDEPAGSTTPRGWLHDDVHCVGFYLDYGPDSHRPGHSSMLNTINGPREVTWCKPGHLCKECEPGDILAVRYPSGPGTEPHASRYFQAIEPARTWVETGR